MEDMNNDRPSLGKQILGAIIGGGLALSLYYVYDYARPKVTAYLTLPAAEGGRTYDLGASNIADKTMDAGDRKRILSRTVRIANTLQSAPENTGLDTVDDHSLDIAWPGNDVNDPKYAEVMAKENVQPGPDIAGEYANKWPKPDSVAMQEDQAAEQDAMMQEQMATMDMQSNDDAWNDLWNGISNDEQQNATMDKADADALPDTGFGLGFIAAGALGGSLGSRLRKKK